jgi:uncharacterized membrane protein
MVFRSILRDCTLLPRAGRFVVLSVGQTGRNLPSGGSLLYLVGTILVTIIFNVPLNDSLAAVDPTSAHAGHLWTTYVRSWTAWNHVRTVAAFAAAASFITALCH